MTTEQLLLERWRNLPVEKQQEVLDFVEFLHGRQAIIEPSTSESAKPSLGHRLRQLRQQIVDSGVPLLNEAELQAEIASRRGGVDSYTI